MRRNDLISGDGSLWKITLLMNTANIYSINTYKNEYFGEKHEIS